MAEKISVLFSEEEVNKRILEMANVLNEEFAGEELHIICILVIQ